ncbi:potassium channel subfamily K member 1-like isoform X2 [Cylas formicarius]|uniref:potassium channel subfamily K member 1-like isoform X2 n=1 Tax=Cylas formicarius TaxID=197179 RepID=UPI0029585865|nr:potassium channel subfamily K member 1-like isoform X2 [Cylas formicarius]XP_060525197.1 potassium channel subfamily K member 1-like isoform X2 [Cylas formicarius]
MPFTSRGMFRFSLFLTGYILFLIVGASIFAAIEEPEELEKVQEIRTLRYNFLKENPCVKDEALEELIVEIISASNRGVSAIKNATGESNWSFAQSLFFTSTVVTTIGYGHVTPLSRSGKVFCILYAMIGIPLTLVLLSAMVERMLIPTIGLLQWLNSKLGHLYQPFNIRLLHLCIIAAILVLVFLAMPAAVFASIEPEWDYLDSLYYCFISLTTIGLGDYIPGDSFNQPYRPLYKILTTAYLFLGITFMMLTLAVFYDIPQLNLGILFAPSDTDDVSSEKVRLASSTQATIYGTSSDSLENQHRQVVRVRSRREDDDDSPDDNTSKPLGIP